MVLLGVVPQVKVKKVETDLLIDQLHEIFLALGQHKVNVSKFEKRLDDVAHKWDDIKKAQPQVSRGRAKAQAPRGHW